MEFYGATEGNVSMLNYDGTVGAVGRVPDYLEWLLPSRVVRFDVEKEMPVRGADGLCIECAPDEAGEALGGMSTRAGREFEGYTNKADSDKKMLRDVFKKGDVWFRTGDLMRRDEHGYFYFVDRIGDTFRWKGENVATGEVARGAGGGAGHPRGQCLWRDGAGRGRARRHGGAGGGWGFRVSMAWRCWLKARLAPYARPIFLGFRRRSTSPARSSSARWNWCATVSILPRSPIRFISSMPIAAAMSGYSRTLCRHRRGRVKLSDLCDH